MVATYSVPPVGGVLQRDHLVAANRRLVTFDERAVLCKQLVEQAVDVGQHGQPSELAAGRSFQPFPGQELRDVVVGVPGAEARAAVDVDLPATATILKFTAPANVLSRARPYR